MIIVFITNKIITLDTILPILIEAKKCNNQKIVIVVSRKNGLTVIENNVVLNDAIKKIGFKFLFGGNYGVRWYKRIVGSFQLILLFIAGIFGAKFIHFEALPILPIKILSKFFKSKVFYSERDSTKSDVYKLASIQSNKLRNKKYPKGNIPIPLGGNIISYNKDRLDYLYGDDIYNKRNVYFLGAPRRRKSWIDYIDKVSDYYFDKFHPNVDTSKGIVFIILSYYGDGVHEDELFAQKKLMDNLENTVKVLSSIKGTIPVFMKPHNYTDVNYIKSVLSGHDGFHITYLHPSILLRKSKFVVSNLYSTIFGDAHSMGIPTVEYAYYPDYIKKDVGDVSMCPRYVDWFVYDDIEKFEKICVMLIKEEFKRKKIINNYEEKDDILEALC